MAEARQAGDSRAAWSIGIAGGVIGFSLGGFFDGIVLHQILQWHHLLSALEGATFRDIRVQILADGIFHAGMYGVALMGLAMLWRRRRDLGLPGSGRGLAIGLLAGFGLWDVVDAVVFHWTLQVHRIRMDVENPLVWDLGWLALFGLVPLGLAYLLARRSGPWRDARASGGAALVLAIGVAVSGGLAALPPRDAVSDARLVVFRAGLDDAGVLAAIAAADAHILDRHPTGAVWTIATSETTSLAALYRHGALLVTGGPLPAGCLDWVRVEG